MKKLLVIIISLLPFISSGQVIIKTIQLPGFFVDSATNLRTYQVSASVPGSSKDKLATVLKQWFASNYTQSDNAGAAVGNNETRVDGDGSLSGSFAQQQLTRDQSKPDKLMDRAPTIDYKVKFTVGLTVTDEKYSIALSNFKIEVFNRVTPLERFYLHTLPDLIVPTENEGVDITELWAHVLQDIQFSTQGVPKSAARYIAKAKKKGTL
jgi:uncharacterized protein with TBP-like fold DUF4468